MQSFRTELENPLVEKDIIDLAEKIRQFHEGTLHEDKFRSLRLARGVYGQRQQGVQMVRIKLPYGKMTFQQWNRISEISDEYSNGNLHLTTRQDIQIHYVSLDKTPELWAKLEQDDVTLREACGNTVRNITASVTAGIDKNEFFDVSPYAHAMFEYFLRNPICQEMGRKIKIAFSNNADDTALTYIHDLGFIPKIMNGKRGFKVLLAGGLGAQPRMADVAFDFLEENQLIPYTEAVLRVFDRHGERISRSKARMKFLVQKIGLETFSKWVDDERKALKNKSVEIDATSHEKVVLPTKLSDFKIENNAEFDAWKNANVFSQAQESYFGVYVRVTLGNISSHKSRNIINALKDYVADDIRVTINQNLMFRFVPQENLALVWQTLKNQNLAELGANALANITACPGTDTCNLAISDSTNITLEFEKVIKEEYADLITNEDIKIKISGCMNACGQHSMAQIGFHGSSLKDANKNVLPALQVLLGGGNLSDGLGRASEKVIKVPSKKGPEVLRFLFDDFINNRQEGEYFNTYFDRQGKIYFYDLLKPLANLENLTRQDYIDWGHDEDFETAIGVGECAAVMIDLVATLILESEEKLEFAKESIQNKAWADAIYHAYSAQVNAAKALLLDLDVNCSTQMKVISEFTSRIDASFESQVLEINKNEPTEVFAKEYINVAIDFVSKSKKNRMQKVLS